MTSHFKVLVVLLCVKIYFLTFNLVDEASVHGLQGQMEENQSVQHEER